MPADADDNDAVVVVAVIAIVRPDITHWLTRRKTPTYLITIDIVVAIVIVVIVTGVVVIVVVIVDVIVNIVVVVSLSVFCSTLLSSPITSLCLLPVLNRIN